MPSLSSNGNYLTIISRGDGGSVQANASAKIGIRVANRWVNIMEALGFSGDSSNPIGKMVSDAFSTFQIFSGNNFLPNIATSHVWRGSEGIELQLDCRFDAWDDAAKDVLQPVQQLLAWYMPTRGGAANTGIASKIGQWFLQPPGPTPWQYINGDDSMLFTVGFGNVMIVDELIPTSLEWEFENRFTKQGDPIAANVRLGFMNYTIPDSNKILGWFLNQQVGTQHNTVTAAAGAAVSSATNAVIQSLVNANTVQ